MKFHVGYQTSEPGEETFPELLYPFREQIAEVFFAWPGHASGRSPIAVRDGKLDRDAFGRFEEDLVNLRALGFKLDLLFNANCYGGDAMSEDLRKEVLAVLRRLDGTAGGADVVTTTSPAVAWILKRERPDIEVRASVNMRIGSVAGMRYLADRFDSYHICRDFNRDLARLRDLRAWADSEGKKLILLANSGCLRECSGQTFHDNLVAHESEVSRTKNLDGFLPYTCWNYLKDPAHWPAILQATWIRPEDVRRYEGLVDGVKLATRLHQRPHSVIGAYVRGACFEGNLAELFEPGFSPLLAPKVLDGRRFPADWFERTTSCDRRCHACGYCERVLKDALVDL